MRQFPLSLASLMSILATCPSVWAWPWAFPEPRSRSAPWVRISEGFENGWLVTGLLFRSPHVGNNHIEDVRSFDWLQCSWMKMSETRAQCVINNLILFVVSQANKVDNWTIKWFTENMIWWRAAGTDIVGAIWMLYATEECKWSRSRYVL